MENMTQGFVLQAIPYGDSSLVVKMFTRQLGLQTYMVKGARNRSSRNRVAFFQPMTFLRFVQSSRPQKTGSMSHLKDVELDYTYQSIPHEMKKSAILIYVAELLSHTLTQQEQNEELYQFVHQSVSWLDLVESDFANFPLFFTLELTRFLGFYPHPDTVGAGLFDMMEGCFVRSEPPHPYYLDREKSAVVAWFIHRPIDELASIKLTGDQRSELLEGMITFVRLHAPLVKGLQSHEILKEVLR